MSTEIPANLPPEVEGLGDFRHEFTGGGKTYRKFLIVGSLLFFVFGGVAAFFATVVPSRTDMLVMVFLFGSFALLGLVTVGITIWRGGQRVLLFADGVVRVHGRNVFVCRWDEIAWVKESITNVYMNGSFSHTLHDLTIKRSDGQKTRLDATLKGIDNLSNIVQGEVFVRLMPRVNEELKNGHPVSFGRIRLTPEGIETDADQLRWEDVEEVTLNAGMLTIRKQGMEKDWLSRRVGDIPNTRVLLSLLEEYTHPS